MKSYYNKWIHWIIELRVHAKYDFAGKVIKLWNKCDGTAWPQLFKVPDNFIQWISHYPTVSICAKISVFPRLQANIFTLQPQLSLGVVRKPWTTFNVKYILDPE